MYVFLYIHENPVLYIWKSYIVQICEVLHNVNSKVILDTCGAPRGKKKQMQTVPQRPLPQQMSDNWQEKMSEIIHSQCTFTKYTNSKATMSIIHQKQPNKNPTIIRPQEVQNIEPTGCSSQNKHT